jgi:hypothetical protein
VQDPLRGTGLSINTHGMSFRGYSDDVTAVNAAMSEPKVPNLQPAGVVRMGDGGRRVGWSGASRSGVR